MNLFLKGSLLLAGAAFISECLEFLINLTLTKELGEYGIGQYMSIVPVMAMTAIIASMELPISIAKFIAEKNEAYHLTLLKYATKLALLIIFLLTAGMALIFIVFPLFQEIHPFIRWSILILIPVISTSSIARGYFMGVQKMGQIAAANLLRRCVHLFALVFLFQLFHFRLEIAILAAVCSLIGGELFVLIYLFSAYVLQLKYLKKRPAVPMEKSELAKSLLKVSVPTTMMRIFHSVTQAVRPFLIKYILVTGGMTAEEATESFGMIAGVAMTIGFFPAFIAHSLMTALIPNVSDAYAKRDQEQLFRLLKQVIALTSLYGIPVTFFFYYFSGQLTGLFLDNYQAGYYLQIMLPFFLLHYFSIPFQAFLIGMNMVKDAFLHDIWATTASFVIMFILGSNSKFLVDGVIVAMNLGAFLLMLLHYLTICKKIGISPFLYRKGKIIISVRD